MYHAMEDEHTGVGAPDIREPMGKMHRRFVLHRLYAYKWRVLIVIVAHLLDLMLCLTYVTYVHDKTHTHTQKRSVLIDLALLRAVTSLLIGSTAIWIGCRPMVESNIAFASIYETHTQIPSSENTLQSCVSSQPESTHTHTHTTQHDDCNTQDPTTHTHTQGPTNSHTQGPTNSHTQEENTATKEKQFDPENDIVYKRLCDANRKFAYRKRNFLSCVLFCVLTSTNCVSAVQMVVSANAVVDMRKVSGVLIALLIVFLVALVSMQFVLTQTAIHKCTRQDGILVPRIHLHTLTYRSQRRRAWCNICRKQTPGGEAYNCKMCAFDCCVTCFKKAGKSSMEGLLRSDKGPKEQIEWTATECFIRALQLSRPFCGYVIAAFACLVVAQLCSITVPAFQGRTLDSIVQADIPLFKRAIIGYTIASVVVGLFSGLQALFVGFVNTAMQAETRCHIFECVLAQDLAFFDGLMTGQITSRISSDIAQMVRPVRMLMNILVSKSLRLVGGLVMCVWTSWELTVLGFTAITPIVYLTRMYASWSRNILKDITQLYADGNSVAVEVFSNIRSVRAFGTTEQEMDRFKQSLDEVKRKSLLDALADSGVSLVSNYLDMTVTMLILWYGGTLALQQQNLTVGQLITFQLYWNMMNNAYQSMNGVFNNVIRAAAAAQRVFSVLTCEPDIEVPLDSHIHIQAPQRIRKRVNAYNDTHTDTHTYTDTDTHTHTETHTETETHSETDTHTHTHTPTHTHTQGMGKKTFRVFPHSDTLSYTIKFEGVKFAYQMRPDSIVLNGLDLTIQGGRRSAIVGRSGCGKSTVMNLIMRMYDPIEGRVLLDEYNLKTLNPREYRQLLGVVSQDTELFNMTVAENISYGCGARYTLEDIQTAAQKARAHEFIQNLDDGYSTKIGERGGRLSGGQRQRLAIARVFLRKPQILLLDEATSALDAENEMYVQEAIDQLLLELQNRCTVIIVAHRLSTVMNADQIYVMNAGQLIEEGTHDELMRAGNFYQNLVQLQMTGLT